MKFALMVTAPPYAHQGADTALAFADAALAQGHEITRIFFYGDGVLNASRLNVPPQDERNVQKKWSALGAKHGIDLVVCIAAAQRRGVINESEAARHALDAENLAPGFRISGLGQLIEAGMIADRTITFGA